MDAVNGEDGQAAIIAVVLIALAALAIAGLREADARLTGSALTRWAGEAAVEAAASVVADAYAGEMRARAADPSRAPRAMRDVVTAPSVRDGARIAAADVSARNGGPMLDDVAVVCGGGTVTVSASVQGIAYRASFAGSECSQP